MYVLGITCVYHESAAVLLKEGRIIAAVEEERFNRIKHGKRVTAENPHELPLNAIQFCLNEGGIKLSDVDHIACAGDPDEMWRVRTEDLPSAWSNLEDQRVFLENLPKVEASLREVGFTGIFHWVAHHTAHAASAYYASSYDKAAVIVIDALGDDAYSGGYYVGDQSKLRPLELVNYPASLGYLWELHSVFLGFDVYDAAKVMGLAAYGKPERFADAIGKLVWATDDGHFRMADDTLRFAEIMYYPADAYLDGVTEVYGVPARRKGEPLTDDHHDIAAALQVKTNEIVMHMIQHLHSIMPYDALCMAGGVALNCVTNRFVYEEGPFADLYVQPAAHDGGCALGVAYYTWHHILDQAERHPMVNAYLGPSYSDEEIQTALDEAGLSYRRVDCIEEEVAQLLTKKAVIGFFQGRMELGPRALGNRSILADPRQPDMRDILNHKVKHREYFRPLAPSVLHEHASEWFMIGKSTPSSDYMLLTYPVQVDKRDTIPAVVHIDGTSRLQTVRQEINPHYHRLISAFYELTNVPLVLNTSFNDQEPIICSPKDAIQTFKNTEIDYLAIGNFLVEKP